MPTMIAEKTVKARKSHLCMTCHRTAIEPGQEYLRTTYVYDGRVYDWVMCSDCKVCEPYVFEWCLQDTDDAGIGASEYEEWASDAAWSADWGLGSSQTPEQAAAIAYLVRRFNTIVDHAWTGVSGHPDDPECSHREDETICGELEHNHLWSTR